MVIDEDIYLEHFGIKGMQWGVRKDRSNHGLNSRARKLQAVADRRPTRGNIRKAQRAQLVADKRAKRNENVPQAVKTIRIVSLGSGLTGAMLASRASSNIGVVGLAGLGSAVAGGTFARKQLIRSGKTSMSELNAYFNSKD